MARPARPLACILRLTFGLLAAIGPVSAQAPRQPPKRAPEPVAPATPAKPAPQPGLDRPLLELSEAIGSLAFLGQLCAKNEGEAWRIRMEGLIESEGEPAGLAETMRGAYNRGFAAFSTSYRQCTPAAKAARELIVQDAARLAEALQQRFGH